MPLTFNIRHLENGEDLHLEGELPTEELECEVRDQLVHPADVVDYDLHVQRLEGAALVQAEVSLDVEYECVRCLKRFRQPLELHDWTVHLPLIGDDKVG